MATNWIIIGALVLLVAIAVLYFTSDNTDTPAAAGGDAPAQETPTTSAPAEGTATGN